MALLAQQGAMATTRFLFLRAGGHLKEGREEPGRSSPSARAAKGTARLTLQGRLLERLSGRSQLGAQPVYCCW